MLRAVVVIALAGCTSWSTTNYYGPKREVARQLLGAPAITQSRSASLDAGFVGTGGGVTIVGTAGGMGIAQCVQQAQILYEQPVTTVPIMTGRPLDVGGAILLAVAGGMTIAVAEVSSHSLFEERDPTPGFIVGGSLIAAGAGLLAYSLGVLPKGPKPDQIRNRREWLETHTVATTGCPTNASPPTNDIAMRLQQLDQLRTSGAINEKEYQRKRKEIIDGI